MENLFVKAKFASAPTQSRVTNPYQSDDTRPWLASLVCHDTELLLVLKFACRILQKCRALCRDAFLAYVASGRAVEGNMRRVTRGSGNRSRLYDSRIPSANILAEMQLGASYFDLSTSTGTSRVVFKHSTPRELSIRRSNCV